MMITTKSFKYCKVIKFQVSNDLRKPKKILTGKNDNFCSMIEMERSCKII